MRAELELRTGLDVTHAVAKAATPIAPSVHGLIRTAVLMANPLTPFQAPIKRR